MKYKIVTLKELSKKLKSIYNDNSEMLVPEDLSDFDNKKVDLIMSTYFTLGECVNLIIELNKKGKASVLPILSRAIYEYSMVITTLFIQKDEKELNRFILFNTMKENKSILNIKGKSFYTKTELDEAKKMNEEYSKNGYPDKYWNGKNLFENCKFLDENYSMITDIEHFYQDNYSQSYPFLSSFTHAQHSNIQNVRKIKITFFKKNYEVLDHAKDHAVTCIYHSITAYLNALLVIGLLTKNEVMYNKNKAMLKSHFRNNLNELRKRNDLLEQSGIAKKKG